MFAASLYQPIYLVLVTILTIIVTNRVGSKIDITQRVSFRESLPGYIVALLFALFIGFRPVSARYFVDMQNYYDYYYAVLYSNSFKFDINTENFLFDNLFSWLGSNLYDVTLLFVILSLCYFLLAYKALTLLFKNYSFLAFVVFLGAFSTFSYATNGIKAGAAASFFLCALGYRDNWLKAAAFLILSLGFHHSMIMPIAAFVIAWFIKNPKIYFAIWILALLISAAHITFFQELFAGMADDSGADYLNAADDTWEGKTGFRFDFVLYSALPVVIGYWAIFKYNLQSKVYYFLLNTYMLTNAIWMLCMYAAFTNRIAYLSWLMYPVVTIYPFFYKEFMPKQVLRLKQVVWFQLLFTLFMSVIYYG